MVITGTTFLKKLIILFLAIAGLYYAQSFFIPVAIAGVLATLFLPVCQWLERIRIPRGLAALLCILLLASIIAGMIFLLGWQISLLTDDFDLIRNKISELVKKTEQFIRTHFGISTKEQNKVIQEQQPSIGTVVQAIVGSITNLFTYLILTLAYIFLILYYRNHLRLFLLKLFPPSQQAEMAQVIHRVIQVSHQYLTGLSKMIFCLWIMYSIGFSIVGVKNAFFFAILCGMLEIVPFIGNITGTTLTLLFSATQGANAAMLIGIAATYGVVQFIQGWVLEPLIVGPHVRINPFATIVALVIGNLIWGIPGIFLAIPLTAMFKIVCDHVEALRPYGFLISETRDHKDKPGLMKRLRVWFSSKK